MVKFINPRTGKASYFSRATVKLGLVPKGLLRDDKPRKLKDVVKKEEEITIEASTTTEPTREQMIEFLKSKKIRVNPNIGEEKLKQRYDENTQEVNR